MKKTVLIIAPNYYGIDTDIQAAFQALGLKSLLVNQAQSRILERVAKKIDKTTPFLKPISNPIRKAVLKKDNEKILSITSKIKPDLIFIIKGENIFPATLEKLKKTLPCPIVSYLWDEPFFVHKENQDDYLKSNLNNCMPLYDHIFVFDSFYVDKIKQIGVKNVTYLPLATNPNRYKEIALTDQEKKQYNYDICFIGVPFENRVEIFECLREYNLGVFGDTWSKFFILKGKKTPTYYRGVASGVTLNKIYRSSKIVLNIHHPQSIEGLNTRTFDIPACGAFEIVDYKKNVETHFKIDEEIVTFKNIDELKSKIAYYLKNDDLRKSITARGTQKVLSEHTWVHRIQKVLTSLSI